MASAAAGTHLFTPFGAIAATKTQNFSLFLTSSHPKSKPSCFQISSRPSHLPHILPLSSPHRRLFPSSLSSTTPFIESYTEKDTLGSEELQAAQKLDSSDAGRLYVGNLPFSITSSELAEIFSQAGSVETAEIVCDRVTNRSRGFGFITMASADEANEAIRMFDGSQLGGRTVKVNFPEVPRGGEREVVGMRPRGRSLRYKDSLYKIYAGNLGWIVTSDMLNDAFSDFPGLVGAKVLYERDSGRSRGCGFVNFGSAEDCQSALQAMDGKASRQWNSKLTKSLTDFGLQQSKADYSLFTKGNRTNFVALLVYVDDIIIAGPSMSTINKLKDFLHSKFQLTDLGELKYFLGLEVARSKKGIVLSQRHYTLKLLADAGKLACKHHKMPMDPNDKLSIHEGKKLDDPTKYRRLIGRLLYLNITRPDIAFAVHKLSQFTSEPKDTHMNAAHHLLGYLKGAPGQGMLFPSLCSTQLKAFSDADWGSCLDTRRSTTGFCIFLGDSMISWKAKRQSTISRSSAESEYRALSDTVGELIWIKQLLTDLRISTSNPALIFCDNQADIHMATNPIFHERTKHIEIDCHFIRDKVSEEVVKLMQIQSSLQLADMFTKAVHPKRLMLLLSKMSIKNIYDTS